jgi:hypothetical protein
MGTDNEENNTTLLHPWLQGAHPRFKPEIKPYHLVAVPSEWLTIDQGDESTFGKNYAFVEHLRKLLAGALPKVDVQAVVYPKYETRGELGECVTRFSDW